MLRNPSAPMVCEVVWWVWWVSRLYFTHLK